MQEDSVATEDNVGVDAGIPDAGPIPDVEAEDETEPDVAVPDVPPDPGTDESAGCRSDDERDDDDECTIDSCDTGTGDCENLYDHVACPDCLEEGKEFEAEDPKGYCCEGLSLISIVEPDPDGGCSSSITTKKLCAYCPDNQCGSGENYCNCPEDCADEPHPMTCGEMGGQCLPPMPGTDQCATGEKINVPGCDDDLLCCKV